MTERAAIRRAMAMLSGPHRVLVYQAYYFKRTTRQLAAELGMPEGAVRADLHAALQQLRHNLRDAQVAV